MALQPCSGCQGRAGVIALGRRIVVEIVGSTHFESVVAAKGKAIVSAAQLELLIAAANKRLRKNFQMMKRFEKKVKKELPRC